MVKKLNQMENKHILLALMLSGIIIGFISCANEKVKNNQGDSLKPNAQNTVDFIPDTSVNSVLFLNHEESISKFIQSERELALTKYLRESPVLILLNKGKDEFLLAYQYEGGAMNRFSAFEIGYVKNLSQKNGVVTNHEHFSTESGLKLGDSVSKILLLKGKGYLNKSDSMLDYEISDYQKSDFLKFHNMPAYSFKCSVIGEKVNGIRYGFVQP